ncbi:MAG: winged helix-turn-helix domain-containing protein, partial [Burkholderiaceae bacterium]
MSGPSDPSPVPLVPQMRLGGHVLDLEAQVLRDADGAPVTLRAQAWAVLRLLALNAGRVVTKEQMLDTVWPGLIVTDGSLPQAISDIRSALGPVSRSVLKTVARRGYMLCTEASDAPTADNTSNLPAKRGPMFGRDADLMTLEALLCQHRIVTVIGTAGIGKTTLALAAAHAHVEGDSRSAAWADLSRISDPALLPATLAQALGLPIAQSGNPQAGLLAALRPLTVLLVLDNAEHLIDSVAHFTRALIDSAAGVQVLVTSQAPLHIEGERVFRLDA